MKVLVTGANGMLGQDLCPMLEDEDFDVIETDLDSLDITDSNAVNDFISKEMPDVVIHCAAYTNVNKAEEELEKAMLINAKGTENVAKACGAHEVVLVYISTDYIFDGTKNAPYLPSDAPNPLNSYGLTKLKGEEAVVGSCPNHYIVRTSWLYGHHGKNFVETMISLKDKEELKVVNDQVGCPTWTVELANGIMDLLLEEAPFGIYHICGGGKTSWFGFAKEIFEQIGATVNLKPCSTDEFPSPAKRPAYSVMDNDKICRNWKLALKDYLALREE